MLFQECVTPKLDQGFRLQRTEAGIKLKIQSHRIFLDTVKCQYFPIFVFHKTSNLKNVFLSKEGSASFFGQDQGSVSFSMFCYYTRLFI